jgi:hypothetical protein
MQIFKVLNLLILTSALLSAGAQPYYSVDVNLKVSEITKFDAIVDLLRSPDIIAISSFVDERNISGWSYLYLQTNEHQPDWFQMYAAGYMEGYLEYEQISYVIHNKNITVNNNNPNLTMAHQFVRNQSNWINKMIKENENDNYWQLVNGTLAQLQGVYDGYTAITTKLGLTNISVSYDDIHLISYLSDMNDIVAKYQNTTSDMSELHCSYLLSLTENGLFGSHLTWSKYTSLLKQYKMLIFHLHNPMVKTKTMAYTCMPGSIPSQNDYYTLDDHKFVAETSFGTDNTAVYEWIHYESVPYWIRIHVANLAFDTQQTWTDVFFNNRSGTYPNQWLVVDFSQYTQNKANLAAAQNIIWMVEEFYEYSSVQDVTQELLIPQGYVASYNVPYDPVIQNATGDNTTYWDAPRTFLFAQYAPGIKTVEDFKYVMRLNNYSDTENYCSAIASRCDLEYNTSFPFGAVDAKVTSDTLVVNQDAWIVNGPTTTVNLPPFSWDNWPQYSNYSQGLARVYNYDWAYVSLAKNFTGDWGIGNSYDLTYE